MRKKILILVRRLDKGGAELLECRLAVQLASLGYETYLGAQYSSKLFSGRERARLWIAAGVKRVFFLDSDRFVGTVLAVLNLTRLHRRFKFDAIISTNMGLQSLVCISNYFIRTRHIAGFHDYLTNEREKIFRVRIWKWLITKIDAGYSITEHVNSNLTLRIPALRKKLQVVYNSINLNLIDKEGSLTFDIREELNLNKNVKLIAYVGRLNYRKGLDILIDCLGNKLAEMNAHIIVIGDNIAASNLDFGKFNYSELLKFNIEKLRISHRVHFLGFRKDSIEIMRQSDILVHLARHEGFGLIFIEAFAARLPIVASNVGGIPEVLRDTLYNTFEIEAKDDVIDEVARILSMSEPERDKMVSVAIERLDYFKDERRANDIHLLISGLM